MNEIENIKAGLTYLLDINDLKNNVTVTEDGKSHSMNVKDLKEANYDVLLQIAEFNGDFLKLEQVYQGEIIVYLVKENDKEEILKIMPPHDEIDQWYVNTESAACLFGVDDLKLYIEILKIVAAFLQEKCVED